MMKNSRLINTIIPAIAVTVSFIISLVIRIALPWDKIFSGNLIKFADPDCWYQLRLVDTLISNFPNLIKFDPFTYFPHGMDVFWHPLFTYILAIPAMILGGGSPDEQMINTVSAFMPAILGALTVIPVYFIGKVLFNRWAGIIAALLIAILPGEFLHRSMLGFTDHHAAESLFITTAFLFFILALKTGYEKHIAIESFRIKDYSAIKLPVVYSVLAGIFLSLYLTVWVGGLLFLFFLLLYFVIQFIVDHLRGESVQYLSITGVIMSICAFIISLPTIIQSHYQLLYVISMPVLLLVPVVLNLLSYYFRRFHVKPVVYPVSIILFVVLAIVLILIIDASLFSYALRQFSFFFPTGVVLSITEAQPLLFTDGNFSFDFAMSNFSMGFFLSIIAMVVLIYKLVKKSNNPEIMLFLVWSVFIFLAMLGQRRFIYYDAINVAILNGYLAWLVFEMFGIRQKTEPVGEQIKTRKNKKIRKQANSASIKIPNLIIAIILVLAIFIYPVTGPLPKTGQWQNENMPAENTIKSSLVISDAWYETLMWLKDNTPDPFDNPEFYYNLYKAPPAGQDYPYPDSAYGVMAWWDYGHMITRIAHRIPISNPHQYGAVSAAKFFTSTDDASADATLDELGARYIIIDTETATTKFHGAVTAFAGLKDETFFELLYTVEKGGLRGDYYFYPEYYQSFAVRLFNFDGKAVTPDSVTVISYKEKTFPEGDKYKEITNIRTFPLYQQAMEYLKEKNDPNTRIVGTNPFISPVPLESLSNKYALVYSSKETTAQKGVGEVAQVKVFEYTE